MLHSHETLNEPFQKQMRARKLSSVLSEDSEILTSAKHYQATNVTAAAPEIVETVISPKAKSPLLNAARKTVSSESKDTLTPLEAEVVDDHTLIENDDDGSVENIMELNFESARQRALRRRSMGRRCSEQNCSNYDLNRSQSSLNAAVCRRQLSLTHSEPDSGNDGNVISFKFCRTLFSTF